MIIALYRDLSTGLENILVFHVKHKLPLETIKRVSKLSEDAIRKLARSMGVAVI